MSNMNALFQHLKNARYWELFAPDEYNNAIRFVYTCIASAVNDEADRLVLKRNGIEWYKDEVLIGKFAGEGYPEPFPSYGENLRVIFARDNIVKRSLIVASEIPDQTILYLSPRS